MNIPFYRFVEVGIFSMLNLMPFLIIAMYPFRRHLRFSYAVTNTLLVVMALVQLCLGYTIAFSPISLEIISPISTAIYAGFYFLVIKDHIGRLSFVLLVFTNLGNMVTVCAKCLEGLIFGDIALETYRWSLLICLIFMHGLITVPVAFYVKKYFTREVPIQTKSWAYLWIIPATFYFIWLYHLYYSGMSSLMVALDIKNTVFLFLINLGAFVVYHTTVLLLLEQKKNTELEQNNYLLSLQTLQHENLVQRINETRRARHDMRHHMHLIQEYLHTGKLHELELYVEQYGKTLPSSQPIFYCQHYETNSLLDYFAHQAKQTGIKTDFFVQLPEKINLPETTLSVLLGNLLENAIDACRETSSGEKIITVRGKKEKDFIFFDVSNTYSGPLKKTITGEFRSTKKNGEGLGLSSVSNLVKKHNGVITVDSKDNVFRVSVILREQNSEQ